jgi:hypothetical protein
MIPVIVEISVTDNVDPAPACLIAQVTNSEAPATGVDPDVQITGSSTVSLRASRLGTGPGRTYTITVRCADFSGNVVTADSLVSVPHDSR